MKVSIFTDASVNPDTGDCGFAFYIGCRTGKLLKAGLLKVNSNNCLTAELHCIANAVYTLTRAKFTPVSKVYIYSDSLMCINALNGVTRSFRLKEHRQVQEEIKFLMMEFCLKHGKSIRDIKTMFELSHIKAHTGKKDKFSIINDWCDKNAKKYIIKPKMKTRTVTKYI